MISTKLVRNYSLCSSVLVPKAAAKPLSMPCEQTLTTVFNISFGERTWTQASLPVRLGGLGIRKISSVALPAFLASVHGAQNLIGKILAPSLGVLEAAHCSEAKNVWSLTCPNTDPPVNPCSQRQWDEPLCRLTRNSLLETALSPTDRARLIATAEWESGLWLQALPSPTIGTLLDNSTFRLATCLRIGASTNMPHRCQCGVMVDNLGHHGLSCSRSAGRIPRHASINDVIRRAFVSAKVPAVLEPNGLVRDDGHRQHKLKHLLEEEEETLRRELEEKQALQECGYCEERLSKLRKYEEEIEREKIRECLKALEREKIARGMQCTKVDEYNLRAVQKAQMEEKLHMEMEQANIDRMWHQVLLDDVRRKEQYEKYQENRRQQEMRERRLAYDEQIASASRKRREMLSEERERENRRLERMRKKMEQDHYEALKRKKEKQMKNRINFIEGHEMKLHGLASEKSRARQMDDNTIRRALQEIERETRRKRDQMTQLQIEKQQFIANHNRERRMAQALEQDRDNVVNQWMREKDNNTDEGMRQAEEKKTGAKKKLTEEYRVHIAERNHELERERQERYIKMQAVRNEAVRDLQKKLDSANQELKRQLEYRQNLSTQIRDTQKVKLTESIQETRKLQPFTKKAAMFKQAMERVDTDPKRTSTNPVHPFRRIMESEKIKTLPSI
ncbi:trichohyalin-like [Cydia pomonella]|uniref:trichohyalin-like n=1 Tax=Cydia pomonella TaxID=82600 RepID=UPI002ADD87CC|nr:trichohyalin-like [Cydia pomonella]